MGKAGISATLVSVAALQPLNRLALSPSGGQRKPNQLPVLVESCTSLNSAIGTFVLQSASRVASMGGDHDGRTCDSPSV